MPLCASSEGLRLECGRLRGRGELAKYSEPIGGGVRLGGQLIVHTTPPTRCAPGPGRVSARRHERAKLATGPGAKPHAWLL
jgi:hypothetical protein